MTWKTFSGKPGGMVFAWQFRRSLPFTVLYWAAMLGVCFWPPYDRVGDRLVAIRGAMLVYAFLTPALQLGGCFSRPQADLVHALPVRREEYFWATLAASLVGLWLPVAPSLFLRGLLCGFQSADIFPHIAAMLVMGTAALIFFTLAAVASGAYFEYALNSFLLTVAYPFLMVYLIFLAHNVIPGLRYSGFFDHFMRVAGSPPWAFAMYMQGDGGFGFVVVWHGLLALGLAGLAYRLYCRRPSEQSGMARRCQGMELFLRVELSLAAACFAGHGMDRIAWDFIPFPWGVPLALGAIILSIGGVWLATELFYHHTLRKLYRHWRPLALSLGVMAALLGALSTGLGLDTAMPAAEEIAAASMSMPEEVDYIRFAWSVELTDEPEEERQPWEERSDPLWPALTSPEAIEKIRALQQKIIQMERAIQFPYLPGRSSNWTEDSGFLEYSLVQGDDFWYNFSIRDTGAMPQRAQELAGEIKALQEEIFTSEEFINSLCPLNALDALDQVEKSPRLGAEGYTYVWSEGDRPRDTARKVSGFSKDFRQKLEAAMRADFSAGRFPTREELLKDEGELYKLFYQRGVEFTAKGGAVNRRGAFTLPAAGQRMCLNPDPVSQTLLPFRVTWEMTETYALLEEEWNRPQKSAR
ncbi:hypothetical protein AALA61_03075 [Oscillospiraceae bacterium 42-9]